MDLTHDRAYREEAMNGPFVSQLTPVLQLTPQLMSTSGRAQKPHGELV
jgi:hypothetical protein